jgi:hypothetical protein
MLYRVVRSENLVIACAFGLLETSGTADRRTRRRGRGCGVCRSLEAVLVVCML